MSLQLLVPLPILRLSSLVICLALHALLHTGGGWESLTWMMGGLVWHAPQWCSVGLLPTLLWKRRGRGICFCRWTSRVLGCRLYTAQDMTVCGSNMVVDCTGCVSRSCDLTCSCPPVETEIKTQRIQDSVRWGNGHFGIFFTTWASVHTYKAFADEINCFVFAGAIHPSSPSDVCHQRLWTWWRSYHGHGLHTDQGKLWTFYTPVMSWGGGGGGAGINMSVCSSVWVLCRRYILYI